MPTIPARCAWFSATALALTVLASPADAQVLVREDSMVIPTYLVNPPNDMPRFYEGGSHQGVQRRVYPYPMNDGLTDVKEDRAYHYLKLENEYVDLGIMPEMGGRIYYAVDKTNDYVWFYRNGVVKPSLIGMVGYWVSGSNAWGFPHHHGPNTVKPMDWTLEEHDDGSKTIWISNIDQRHRMRILVGYTLYPGSSLVEMTIRPTNRTPVVNSFLFWANPSVHVDTNYQVIFPPSVQYVTQHHKREMTTWPVADRYYNNFDYTGVDISMWKNVGVPSSFFSWNPRENYFGGYDHGREAGTAWVGNRHVTPGMKYWAWGNNPGGDRANAGLTDDSGHYIELMAGAYTDNQPDYSWLQPYEGKDVKMIWFPIRELGGLKYANRYGALNLTVEEGSAAVRLNTTSSYDGAIVRLYDGEEIVHEETISIDPANPYATDVPLPAATTEDDLTITLSHDHTILLSYAPKEHHPPAEPMPDPLSPPADPADVASVEELYLTGLRLDQFYNASVDPMPYYEEALGRDPGNYAVNTQLGIKALKGHRWDDAERHFQTAVDRVQNNYTRARDGEALYYLGYVQKLQGRLDEAYDNLYRATWNAGWHTPAYYQLAEIDAQRGDYDKGLEHVDRALSTNTNLATGWNLRGILLRKLGRLDEAREAFIATLDDDPLDHLARNELALMYAAEGANGEEAEALTELMRDEVQTYLELATDYGNAGFYDEAVNLLQRLESRGSGYPMMYYFLGYYARRAGDEAASDRYYQAAAQKPHRYNFPFRAEAVLALRDAMAVDPGDAMAPYYLGNLLYEHQPEEAIALWEQSRQIDDGFYITHRNLALAYDEIQGDVEKARTSLERAVALNSDDPRLLYEMDELYEKSRAPSDTKYALLKENAATAARRTESLLRLATRAIEAGHYDEAIGILENNAFPQFEGGTEMQDAFLNGHVLRGMERMESGDLEAALADFETALAYPVGRFGRARWAQLHFSIGRVHEAAGRTDDANAAYQAALDVIVEDGGSSRAYRYYHGLALKELGREVEARQVFQDMLDAAQRRGGDDYFRSFEAGQSRDARMADNNYLIGLAYEGLGDADRAAEAFNSAAELDPSHVWANFKAESASKRP